MAQLDYAMLAEFARADNGLLTVVGGGFDRLQVPSPGLLQQFYLVMRFQLADDEQSVAFEVKVVAPPAADFRAEISGSATATPSEPYIPGNLNALSVIGLGLPISTPGRYAVDIHLEGKLVRELPLEVEFTAQSAS